MYKHLFWLLLLSCGFWGCDELLKEVNNNNQTNNNSNNNSNNNQNNNPTNSKFSFIPAGGKGQQIDYKYYSLSYSTKHKNPEWVAYPLTAKNIADAEANNIGRASNFKKDPQIAETATNEDYAGSGYDKGHLAPAEDMSFNQTAMDESFYITNVSPQDPSFNRGIWKSLEDKVRGWAAEFKQIYVVAGGILPARVAADYKMGDGAVTIPKRFYKIILDYKGKKGIAFIFDNVKATKTLPNYAVSIAEVEQATGLNFFPSLSATEQEQLEQNFEVADWGL